MPVLATGFILFCGFSHTVAKNEKFDVKLLASFTTRFDGGNEARSHNIRLAAKLIDGVALKCGETFSFNRAVGERTAARGFQSATIIENGGFTEGIGGGVCQVSTTLYNAALLCGCAIVEHHPHSLAISYVPPSCDAMVSGTFFDLRFKNTTGGTLYFTSSAGKNFLTFKVWGKDFGVRYSYRTLVTGAIAAPEEFTDDISLVCEGRDGILSEGYLTVTKNGRSREILLRRDAYAPRKRVTLKTDEQIKDGQLPEISENRLSF